MGALKTWLVIAGMWAAALSFAALILRLWLPLITPESWWLP